MMGGITLHISMVLYERTITYNTKLCSLYNELFESLP